MTDVSKKRLTQFSRHASSPRAKRFETLPVMHLPSENGGSMQAECEFDEYFEDCIVVSSGTDDALVPARSGQSRLRAIHALIVRENMRQERKPHEGMSWTYLLGLQAIDELFEFLL